MIRRHIFLISSLFLYLLVAGLAPVSECAAADCKALHEKIRKERTLMRKKELALDAVKVCPNDAAIVYQYGYSMERLRKYDDALEQYNKAVRLDPGYAKAYFSSGDIQMLLKNYLEAIVAYQAGLQHEADDGRAILSLKEARAKYKDATGKEAPSAPPPIKKQVATKEKEPVKTRPAAVVKQPAKTAKPSVAAFAEAPVVRLQVPFYKKSTDLSQDARDVLSVVVGQAMNRPDMKDVKFEIGGHTDNIGDPKENKEISKKRAEAVKNYLVNNFGISETRLITVAHGQQLPNVPNTSTANQEENRRVQFRKIN